MERPKINKEEVKRRVAEALVDLTIRSRRQGRSARRHAAGLIRLFPDRAVKLPPISEEATPPTPKRDYHDVEVLVDSARSLSLPISEESSRDS